MKIGEVGLIFLCVLVDCIIAVAAYWSYLFFVLEPKFESAKRSFPPEFRLIPALFAVFGPPIGLFLYAWTARAEIHWIIPKIRITIFSGSSFVVFQHIPVYVPSSYPPSAASLFVGKDFFRAAFAAAAVMFARHMFAKLRIARGASLLGGLSVMGILVYLPCITLGLTSGQRANLRLHKEINQSDRRRRWQPLVPT